MNKFVIIAFFGIFSLGLLGFNQDAYAHTIGYKDQYAPDKWKLTNFDTDGYLGFHTDVSIRLFGGDDDTKEGLPGDTDYKLKEEIPCDGTIKFDWIFDGEEVTEGSGPLYDPSGYLINGVFHQVTLNFGGEVQSGSEFVPVSEGDVFGFRIHSLDNIVGPGIFVELNNFEGPLCIGDLDDEAYLSKPSDQFMTLEKAREKFVKLTIREYRFLYGHNQAGPLGEALFLLKDDKPENDKSVCGKLTAFIKLVNAPGNKLFQEEDRTKLTAETNKIMTNMG